MCYNVFVLNGDDYKKRRKRKKKKSDKSRLSCQPKIERV